MTSARAMVPARSSGLLGGYFAQSMENRITQLSCRSGEMLSQDRRCSGSLSAQQSQCDAHLEQKLFVLLSLKAIEET